MVVHVSASMLGVLEDRLDRGWFGYREVAGAFPGGEGEALRVLLEMYSQGLLDYREGDVFVVTETGRRVLDAWRASGRPSTDPWLDSRVYTMLYSSVRAGGRLPARWAPLLEERGLAVGGELAPHAFMLQEALEAAERRIVLTKQAAVALLQAPEGPAEAARYPPGWRPTLEALGLLVKSVPNGGFAALTRAGRLLRRALRLMDLSPPAPAVVNKAVYEALAAVEAGGEAPEELRPLLGSLGLLTGTGALTPAGRLVLRAWREVRARTPTPPMGLSRDEIAVLRAVEEQWEKARSNPREAPSRRVLRARLAREGWEPRHYTLGLVLHQLEALGLAREEYDEELKETVVKLTSHGRRVLSAGPRPASAIATRVLVEADQALGFSEEWMPEARESGVVGTGGPTGYGRALQAAARSGERSLLVTSLEVQVLRRLPAGRSMERGMVARGFPGEEDAALDAMDKLESKGLLETLPDGRVIITGPGLRVKNATIAVPAGVATPVTPFIIRLLEAVEKLGSTEDLVELVRETGLSLPEVKDALVIARASGFIGRKGITGAGKELLEAVRELRAHASLEA